VGTQHNQSISIPIIKIFSVLYSQSPSMKLISALVCATLLAQQTAAHPGQSAEKHAKEIAERSAYLSTHKRSLAHCAETLKARGNDLAMAHRRSAAVEQLRAKRSINLGELCYCWLFPCMFGG
jgi:hypothetical protein